MATQKVLIKGHKNYADEFDLEFYVVMDQAAWELLDKNVKKLMKNRAEVEVYFGTNEAAIFEDYKDWRRCLTVTSISEQDAKVITTLLSDEFGTGSGAVTSIVEILADNDEGSYED